jgi:hypothetical protein
MSVVPHVLNRFEECRGCFKCEFCIVAGKEQEKRREVPACFPCSSDDAGSRLRCSVASSRLSLLRKWKLEKVAENEVKYF